MQQLHEYLVTTSEECQKNDPKQSTLVTWTLVLSRPELVQRISSPCLEARYATPSAISTQVSFESLMAARRTSRLQQSSKFRKMFHQSLGDIIPAPHCTRCHCTPQPQISSITATGMSRELPRELALIQHDPKSAWW